MVLFGDAASAAADDASAAVAVAAAKMLQLDYWHPRPNRIAMVVQTVDPQPVAWWAGDLVLPRGGRAPPVPSTANAASLLGHVLASVFGPARRAQPQAPQNLHALLGAALIFSCETTDESRPPQNQGPALTSFSAAAADATAAGVRSWKHCLLMQIRMGAQAACSACAADPR